MTDQERPPGQTETFAEVLRNRRRAAQLTQEALAERAGISARTVSDLERGAGRLPGDITSLLLANALGLAGSDREAFFALRDRARTPQPAPAASPPDAQAEPDVEPRTVRHAERHAERHAAPLPAPADSLVGREKELAAVVARLADPGVRALTLLGPGGVGKTRLALEAARRIADAGRPVAWAPLEALGAPEEVLPAIARAVGAAAQSGADEDPVRRIADALAGRQFLLVVDNCEHVIDAARDLSAVLAAVPDLQLLATTREALRIGGEVQVPVAPLPVPGDTDDDAEATRNAAVALFLDRAGLDPADPTAPTLRHVRFVVTAVDGLPLAIELAAALACGMNVRTVASLLDGSGLDTLAGGRRDAHPRLRSMADAVRWSYDLLGQPERRLLRLLSVFRGGADIGLLADVCAGLGEPALLRGLPGLVRATLVADVADGRGDSRLRILSPIRLFAEAELAAAGEAPAAEAAHVATMRAFARDGFARIMGPEPLAGLAAMDQERDNLAAALDRAIRAGDAGDALALAAAMSVWWEARGELAEGMRGLDRALAMDLAAADPRDVSQVGRIAATFAFLSGRFDRCDELASLMLRAAEEAGYAPGIAIALTWIGDLDWHVRGDAAAARAPLERAVAMLEPLGPSLDLAQACTRLGDYLVEQGEPAAALPLARRAIAIRRGLGNVAYLPGALHPEASALVAIGRTDEARACLLETARAAQDLSAVSALYALMRLAVIDAADANPARREAAALLIGAADAMLERLRMALDPTMAPSRDQALADLASALGATERDRLLAEGRALTEAEALEIARVPAVA